MNAINICCKGVETTKSGKVRGSSTYVGRSGIPHGFRIHVDRINVDSLNTNGGTGATW